MKNLTQNMRMTVPCSEGHLGRVREAVREMFDGTHVSRETARDVVAGIDETVSELMVRSRNLHMERDVALEVGFNEEQVRVSIRNDGPCFDPEDRSGNAGYYCLASELIRKIFDDIDHSYADHERNHLVLTKNLVETMELQPA